MAIGKPFDDLLEEIRTRNRRQKIWIWLRYRLPHLIKYAPSGNYRKIKWFIQRGKRGWADVDAWDINDYITSIMIGMLSRMLEGGLLSYPDRISPEEWESILKQMLEGFQIAQQILSHDYQVGEDFKEKTAVFHQGMDLFKQWYFSLWD